MAQFRVFWRVQTETDSAERALHVAHRFAEELEHKFEVSENKLHHHDPKFVTLATSSIEAETVQEAVYAILRNLCYVHQATKKVIGPFEYEGGQVELDVYLSDVDFHLSGSCIKDLGFVHMYFHHDPRSAK